MQKKLTILLYCSGAALAAVYFGWQQPQMPLLIHEPVKEQFTTAQKPVVTNTSTPTGHNAMLTSDPVNDFIGLPEEPSTQGYAPTSIKDFEAADPATGINMIPVPAANSLGNAVLNFTMNLPQGRQGMNPDINIAYNNEGGTSWMGTGWNLLTPAISIDTRWGVPRFDATRETEMYLLSGEQLAPVNNRDSFVIRTAEKRFYPRVEEDFSKIIRHGDSPASYWWEVAEKNGRKNYYGGRPGSGVVDSSVLKDDNGNIAYWGLTETRDLNDNNIRYEYQTAQHAGLTGGTQQGRQLYLRRIYYTGHGNANGVYQLEFMRNNHVGDVTTRKDIVIDARLGFKQVSAALLRKVRIFYNTTLIRSYEFQYTEGAFYKTLLKSVRELDNRDSVFYSQDFDYYDDIRDNNTYRSSASQGPWQMPRDGIKGGIINPIPQFEDHGSAISVAKVKSAAGGLVITFGGVAGGLWSKKLTVGGGFTYGQDNQEEILSLIDINGDNLPDKVFKQFDLATGLHLYYRPNLGGTLRRFGEKKIINGVVDFGTSKTESVGGGGQALPYSGFFGVQHISSYTTSKIFFADFNGDGLIDIADGGTVYFNHLNSQGDPEFSTNSKETPSPVYPGKLDPEFLKKDTARQAKQERDFPLQDVMRFWKAPATGTVNITAPVQLIEVPNPTGFINNKKDGVRVSIQHAGDTLWSTTIGPNDYTVKAPTNVSALPVTKGQRIYFRVQSIYNGDDDLVSWDPIIQYTTPVTPQSDQHHKTSNYYRASEDFVLHSKNAIGMGKQGAIEIDGRFKKQITTDSVYLQVTHWRNNIQTILFTQGYAGNEVVDEPVKAPGQMAVDTSDELYFTLLSKSYIDRSAMQWSPHYAYVAITDGTPITSAGGKPTMEGYPIPDNSNYNQWLREASPVIAAQKDTVVLRPQVSGGGNGGNGTLWFTIKGTDTVYARRRIFLNGGTMNPVDSIRLIRNPAEPLFLEYATDSLELAALLGPTEVRQYADSSFLDTATATMKDTLVLKNTWAANLYTNPPDDFLGAQFRGWGQFAFKGDKGNTPIDENKLNLDELTNNTAVDPNAFTDTADMSNIPNPSKAEFVTLYSDPARQLWLGYDTSVFVTPNTMSSSRLYMHDVSVDSLPTGAGAIYKTSNTEVTSYSLGVTVSGTGPSAGLSNAKTYISSDMMDLNGDRYPDALCYKAEAPFPSLDIRHVMQYTMPHGGLGDHTVDNNTGLAATYGFQKGVGLGGEYERAFTGNKTTKAASGAQNTARAAMGLSGSLNFNDDYTGNTWMDINGDGLPDRIWDNGDVMLNLGYKFAPTERWDFNDIDKAKSLSYGGGLGINLDGGSFEGGFGISRTEGRNSFMFNDLNGDGLPDQMSMVDDVVDKVYVRFNNGAGFGPWIEWKGYSDIAAVMSVGESFNMAVTITIPIYIIFMKICINPSGNGGQGVSRQEKAFMDIDGDGYADYVESKDDGELIASASAIGRTNMLSRVQGPLAKSYFTIDYERMGNTFDMPQSKWVMKNITAFDGAPGDGIDTIRRRFEYEGGRQDRHEREFYGFSKVTTRELNTADQNKVYRSFVQQYSNTSFYNKGLIAAEWTEDATGNKYTQTKYIYDIKPVQDSVRFPALKQTENYFYEGATTTNVKKLTSYEYDALGNITRIEDEGDGSAAGRNQTTITYHNNDNLYLKSAPATVEIGDAQGVKRKRTTTYNAGGAPIKMQSFLADGTAAVTDLEYDAYGNITTLTKPANYKNQRMSYTYEYDPQVHTYPTKITDAFGYITTSEYDYRFGLATHTLSRNNEPTRYEFDNFGRLIRFTGPYELAANKPYTIAIDYHHKDPVPYAITKHYDPEYDTNNNNSSIDILNFSDGWGRSIQLKKQVSLFKGASVDDEVTMVVSGTDEFDAFGRVVRSWYPVLESIGPNTQKLNGDLGKFKTRLVFDVTDRLTKQVYADSATTAIAWTSGNSGLSMMVTDPLGNRTEKLSDVFGNLRLYKTYTTGGVLTTRYDYNAVGEMVKVVDNAGNAFTATYDNLGRKIATQHPDAGQTTFEYDLAGNLFRKITAEIRMKIKNGGAIQYQYDYDRLTEIDYPHHYQNKVKYTYGAPGTGAKAGRVTLQEDASGGQEFFYSTQGQVVKTIRTVMTSPNFGITYVSEQEFDSWNRLKKMVYPDGEAITYHYNKSGALKKIDGLKKGSTYKFVEQLGYDEFDQRVYMRYSNGTENTYSYDDKRRRLAQLRALSPTGQPMLSNNYTYDAVSNMTGFVNDAQAGATRQDYRYDALYRLDSATGVYSGAAHFGLKMDYDNIGNIVRKSWTGPTSTGNYKHDYVYGGTAPHQATQIGAHQYTYDANGNQLGNEQVENFYDEESRLIGVINKGVLHQFTYDADDNRIVKSSGGMQSLWVNGAPAGAVYHDEENYSINVSPYVVAKKSQFVKHYYIEGQRIASKPGHGNFTNINFPQTGLTAGGVDYSRRAALIEKARTEYYASLGVSPGPPTDKLFWAKPQNTGIAAPVIVDTAAANVPPGWPGNPLPPPNGPPIFVNGVPSRDSVKAGYGFEEAGHFPETYYFYHVDNTGSTNYVTNFNGEVIQQAEYAPTGEMFFYRQTGSFETPYLFNGKGLDAETGYYNYNTAYYDPALSQWLTVPDPFGDGYPGYGSGVYCLTGNNSVGDMVSNPSVSKVGYSGSTDAESDLVENKADEGSNDKISKDKIKKLNNNPKRKILANRYANILLENRYNRKLEDKDDPANELRTKRIVMPKQTLLRTFDDGEDDDGMWSNPGTYKRDNNPVRPAGQNQVAGRPVLDRGRGRAGSQIHQNTISNAARIPARRLAISGNLPAAMQIKPPLLRNTGFRGRLNSIRTTMPPLKRR
jgi:RHS repeat-associated protein